MLLCAVAGWAQQAKKPEEPKPPQVRVNLMNVCTPTAADRDDIAAALNRIPAKPKFGADFEIARGHTTVDPGEMSTWVRVRHDFAADSAFATAQYSFSEDPQKMIETLVVRPRDTKDMLQVSIEDSVTSATDPASVLTTDTPPNRIKVERLGKPSIGLDRCGNADQSSYEPLFRKAAEVMTGYRASLRVRSVVPEELARVVTARRAAKK